ncbi:hypothetical protein SNEBB_009736 [Seison nebaliae]|nr:hypothetical protein SNEBB_009736 [Seison nebaliae]
MDKMREYEMANYSHLTKLMEPNENYKYLIDVFIPIIGELKIDEYKIKNTYLSEVYGHLFIYLRTNKGNESLLNDDFYKEPYTAKKTHNYLTIIKLYSVITMVMPYNYEDTTVQFVKPFRYFSYLFNYFGFFGEREKIENYSTESKIYDSEMIEKISKLSKLQKEILRNESLLLYDLLNMQYTLEYGRIAPQFVVFENLEEFNENIPYFRDNFQTLHQKIRSIYGIKWISEHLLRFIWKFEELYINIDKLLCRSIKNLMKLNISHLYDKELLDNFDCEYFIYGNYSGSEIPLFRDISHVKRSFCFNTGHFFLQEMMTKKIDFNVGKFLNDVAWDMNENILLCTMGTNICRKNIFKKLFTIGGICWTLDTKEVKLSEYYRYENTSNIERTHQRFMGVVGGFYLISLKLMIHPPGQIPNPSLQGYILHPGFHHDIQLREKTKKRFHQKYSNGESCRLNEKKTNGQCISEMVERERRQACNCLPFSHPSNNNIDHSWLFRRHQIERNIDTVCSSFIDVECLTVFNDKFLRPTSNTFEEILKNCRFDLCDETELVLQTLTLQRLDEDDTAPMREDQQRRCGVDLNVIQYELYLEPVHYNGSIDIKEAQTILKNKCLTEDNWRGSIYSFNVYFNQFLKNWEYETLVTENYEIFGEVAGTACLFMGMSLITVIELLSYFIFNLPFFLQYFKLKSKNNIINPTKTFSFQN